MLASAPVLAAALLLTACDLFGVQEDDYYPISLGNMWNYKGLVEIKAFNGDTISSSSGVTEVTAETRLTGGEDVFEITRIDTTFAKVPSETTLVYTSVSYTRKTDDYVLGYESLDDTEPDTALVLPLEEGKTWTVQSWADTTTTATVLVKESVTVPAGTYDCFKVRTTTTMGSQSYQMYWWYAEGVGLVKSYLETSQGGLVTVVRNELVSHDIK